MNFLIIAFLINEIYSHLGIDIYLPRDNMTCVKENGFNYIITRGFSKQGVVDKNGLQNLINAHNAGIAADLYFFPCRSINASIQVQQFVDFYDSYGAIQGETLYRDNQFLFSENPKKDLKAGRYNITQKSTQRILVSNDSFEGNNYQPIYDENSLYQTVWIDIEENPASGCGWSDYTGEENCQFVQDLVQSLEKQNKKVGIYASHYMWNLLMGDPQVCTFFTHLPLWYAHYDNQSNFNDWQQYNFGGWTKPSMKQYLGDQFVCNEDADFDYF